MKALNSNKKNIIIIISIAVLTIVLEFAMISRVTINLKGKFYMRDFFEDWKADENSSVAELVFTTQMYYAGKEYFLNLDSSILSENILAVYNDQIYYVRSEPTQDGYIWTLCSKKISKSDEVSLCSLKAEKNFQNVTQRLYKDMDAPFCGGYYHKNKIVLRNQKKTLELDLTTGDYNEYALSNSQWPETGLLVEIDYKSENLVISNQITGRTQMYSSEQLINSCAYKSDWLNLAQEQTWTNYSRLNSCPLMVYVFDDRIYLVYSMLNYWGHAIGVTFEFDDETGEISYVNHAFVSDSVSSYYHLIPVAN